MASLLMLSGCLGYKEVNDLAIVTGAAVDRTENQQLHLTLQIAVPGKISTSEKDGGESKASVTVSDQGETVMDAFRNIQKKLSRKLFFSHNEIIIIGNTVAAEGVSEILDFFTRYNEARLKTKMLIANGEAGAMLSTKPLLEKLSSEEIRKTEIETPMIEVTLKEFLDMLLTEGIEPIAPQISIQKIANGWGNNASSANSDNITAINGAAIFRGDRLAGWLGDKETRGIQWLRNHLKTGVITINMPQDKGGGRVSLEILKNRTNITPMIVKGKAKMEIDIWTKTDLYENTSGLALKSSNDLHIIERLVEKDVKQRLESALVKAQQMGSDIFGFGNAIQRKYPSKWKNIYKESWGDDFRHLEVIIIPHAQILRTGNFNQSLLTEKDH